MGESSNVSLLLPFTICLLTNCTMNFNMFAHVVLMFIIVESSGSVCITTTTTMESFVEVGKKQYALFGYSNETIMTKSVERGNKKFTNRL